MRLEYTPQLLMGIILCRRQRCCDLLWMMGIIIDDGHAANLALFLKTAVGSRKLLKSCADMLHINSQIPA